MFDCAAVRRMLVWLVVVGFNTRRQTGATCQPKCLSCDA